MKKRATGKASAAGKKKKPVSAANLLKSMEKKLALIGYVRGKDWSRELIETLQATERELANCQEFIRTCAAGSEEETEIMERLKDLEIKRFQLLGDVHKNRVNDYHVLIS